MNRTMLFRGKDVKTGEWVYGDLVTTHPLGGTRHFKSHRYIVSILAHGGFLAVGQRNWVDSDTIGQFTGLYDCNHKMIFEGDIIAWKNFKYEIYYDCAQAGFAIARDGNKEIPNGPAHQAWIDRYHLIVIGNIYDDPDLFRVEKE